MVKWLNSRGPVGFRLSLAALLVFCPFPYLDGEIFGVAQVFAAGLLVASLVAAGIALMHHEKGWEAVRIVSFCGSWIWGALLAVHLLLLRPDGSAITGVAALGVATVVWTGVFQYFRRDAIQRLFPDRTRARSLRRV